jgi:cell division protein FtsI (penicillin-binding protein 3)
VPASWRVWLVGVLMSLLVAGVCLRVVLLQSEEERTFLKRQGDARTVRTLAIQASRGVVYDRRGEPLAVSTPVASVWVNPGDFDLTAPAATTLARKLGYRPGELTARIEAARERNLEFVYLRRRLAPTLVREIAELAIPGVEFEEEYKRHYPAGEVAAHVVGITNVDDEGLEGLELAFDHHLSGTPGAKRVIRDRRGRVVRDLEYLEVAEPGRDLILSIDLRLQYLAYRELKAAISQYGAKSGTVVVLDNQTGEVLAMVNQPSYNPNAPVTRDFERLRNRAVTDVYEPGSTVKPFTVAAALESGRFQAEQVIDTSPGWIRVGGKTIKDPLNRGPLSLAQIIAKSSQVGITRMALDLEEDSLRDLFARFGLGAPTGIEFPGESGGSLPGAAPWPLIDRVTFAFGYGLAVTPLQLAQAYTVFANGGVLATPSILRRSEDQVEARPLPVVAPEIATRIASMLEGVVRSEGTAARAAIPGYRVAGKTGTARKFTRDGYDAARHLAYFAGFAPASAPRVTAVVLINEPSSEDSGGGMVAAPVFSRVVGGALRLLNVPPDVGTTPEGLARAPRGTHRETAG